MKPKNASSRLRHRLTLQQESRTADGAGGFTVSWQDVADVWAEIEPLGGSEKLHSQKLQATVTHRIMLRYRANITADMRLMDDSRIFNIRAVKNLFERDELIEILAEEGGAI